MKIYRDSDGRPWTPMEPQPERYTRGQTALNGREFMIINGFAGDPVVAGLPVLRPLPYAGWKGTAGEAVERFGLDVLDGCVFDVLNGAGDGRGITVAAEIGVSDWFPLPAKRRNGSTDRWPPNARIRITATPYDAPQPATVEAAPGPRPAPRGICHCGDYVDAHTFGHGHAPVEMEARCACGRLSNDGECETGHCFHCGFHACEHRHKGGELGRADQRSAAASAPPATTRERWRKTAPQQPGGINGDLLDMVDDDRPTWRW